MAPRPEEAYIPLTQSDGADAPWPARPTPPARRLRCALTARHALAAFALLVVLALVAHSSSAVPDFSAPFKAYWEATGLSVSNSNETVGEVVKPQELAAEVGSNATFPSTSSSHTSSSARFSSLAASTPSSAPRARQRFLLPTTIGEQESRAHVHLFQLASLAHALNRTLVLPRVNRARFSSCGAASFEALHAPEAFARETAGVLRLQKEEDEAAAPWLQRDFEAWLAEQPEDDKPAARAVALSYAMPQRPPPPAMGRFVFNDRIYPEVGIAPCLDKAAMDWADREPMARYEEVGPDREGILTDLRAFDEQDGEGGVEVLLVEYNLRGALWNDVAVRARSSGALERAFAYRQEWHNVAEAALQVMSGAGGTGAVVGVHWRQETVEPDNLPSCGQSLVTALEAAQVAHPGAQGVYLATDFPLEALAGAPARLAAVAEGEGAGLRPPISAATFSREGLHAHSDTFSRYLTRTHVAAMEGFLSSFSSRAAVPPANLTLHTFESLQRALVRANPSMKEWTHHPAARNIVDLLVLEQADVFLAGFSRGTGHPPNEPERTVCARRSNWTMRIQRARSRKWVEQKREGEGGEGNEEKKGRRLRNVLANWSGEGRVKGLTQQ
ncbi:hypothetical protein JCM10207_008945 [Rhodosporidiobolus poonsookiae]